MEWFANLLRHYPELAIFLTLAFGFWIGKFKIKKFTLGTVTSVLLVGVLDRTIAYRYRSSVEIGIFSDVLVCRRV